MSKMFDTYEFAYIQDTIDACFQQDPDNPLTEEQIQNNLAVLDAVGDMEAKYIDDIGRQYRSIQAHIDAIRAEEQRLAAKRRYMESMLLRHKEKLMEVVLLKSPSRKIKGEVYSLSVRYTQSVCIDNLGSIPKQYIKTKVETSADKIALRKLLKEGAEIAGVHLESNPSLQVG